MYAENFVTTFGLVYKLQPFELKIAVFLSEQAIKLRFRCKNNSKYTRLICQRRPIVALRVCTSINIHLLTYLLTYMDFAGYCSKPQDRIPSKRLRDRLGLDDIISVLRRNRLRLYGHVVRKEDDNDNDNDNFINKRNKRA